LANEAEFGGRQLVIFATFRTAPSIAMTLREGCGRLREFWRTFGIAPSGGLAMGSQKK